MSNFQGGLRRTGRERRPTTKTDPTYSPLLEQYQYDDEDTDPFGSSGEGTSINTGSWEPSPSTEHQESPNDMIDDYDSDENCPQSEYNDPSFQGAAHRGDNSAHSLGASHHTPSSTVNPNNNPQNMKKGE